MASSSNIPSSISSRPAPKVLMATDILFLPLMLILLALTLFFRAWYLLLATRNIFDDKSLWKCRQVSRSSLSRVNRSQFLEALIQPVNKHLKLNMATYVYRFYFVYVYTPLYKNDKQVLMFYHLKTRRCVNTILM